MATITKTCKHCHKPFQCGTGTKKSSSDKFCNVHCATDFYKDYEKLPPPPGCRL